MKLAAGIQVLDSLATVNFPKHDCSVELFYFHVNFHGKRVRIVRLCGNGNVDIQIENADGSLGEKQENVSVWHLIFD